MLGFGTVAAGVCAASFSCTGNAGVGAVGFGGAGGSSVRRVGSSDSLCRGSSTKRSATTVGGAAGSGCFDGSIGG
jgi:hypothetical protein